MDRVVRRDPVLDEDREDQEADRNAECGDHTDGHAVPDSDRHLDHPRTNGVAV